MSKGKRTVYLFSILMCISSMVYAQEINWSTSYPKITTSEPITVLGDNASFDIQFTPLNADITDASIEIKLPAQMEFVSAQNIGSGTSADITFTTTTSGTITTGKTVKITITSDENKLIQNQLVDIRLQLKALCGANTVVTPTLTAEVYSGSSLVTNGQRSYQTSVQVPTITLTSATPNITYDLQGDIKTFSVSLASSRGEASSVKVFFKTSIYSTLDHFKIEGTNVPYTLTTTSTEKTYTLTLTSAELGGKLGSISKEITFDASSVRCRAIDKTITTSTQYPAESVCATYTGVALTMVFMEAPGMPEMEHIETKYVDENDVVMDSTHVNIDGVTPTNVRTIFRNKGTGDAYDTEIRVRNYGLYAYIDTSNVYYQIEGEAAKVKVPASQIRINSRLGSGNQNYGFYPNHSTKPKDIYVTINDIIPIGKTVSLWFPTISGNIYENGRNNIYWDYSTYEFLGIASDITAINNRCGDPGPENRINIRIYYSGCPHFRQLPMQHIYKAATTHKETIRAGTGSHPAVSIVEIFVKLPSWLTLDGTEPITWTRYEDGSGYKFTPLGGITNHGNGIYSLKYQDGEIRRYNDNYLHVNFKAGQCDANENKTDTVEYWFTQYYPNGTMERISQVFQPVVFECLMEGITLEEFGPIRTTKGLKDSNNDSNPDDGTIAPDNEIRHDIYMKDDNGYFSWKGTIVGNDNYNYLYAPLTSVGFSHNLTGNANLTPTGNYTIEVKRSGMTNTYNIDYVNVDNYNSYFCYDASTNPLRQGDEITIRTPFRITVGADNYNSVETELFVSKVQISDPMNSQTDPNRFGQDRSSARLGSYSYDNRHAWWTSAMSETFSDNSLKFFGTGYTNIFHTSKITTPYFENEVRRHLYLHQLIWELPDGYIMEDPMTFNNTQQLDLHSRNTKSLNMAAESTTGRIVYNVHELYDLTYDGSGTVDANKWMLPDDKWNLNPMSAGIRATRAAASNSLMKRTAIFKNPITGKTIESSINVIFTYTGVSTTLSTSTNQLTAYGPTVVLPSLDISNPSTVNIQDMWVYIKGNIENLQFKNIATNQTGSGIGIGGRWYKVSNSLLAGTSAQYELSFSYKGNDDCSGDTLYIYSAAGFENAWNPDISQEFDITDYDHLGASAMVIIQSGTAKVAGSINTNTTNLNEGVPYTLSATISSASSPGALKDPEMLITIPAGQQYITGSAVIEYPGGTTVPVTTAFESALAATNAGLATDRTFLFSLKNALGVSNLLMAGYLALGVTANDMTATLKADFVPTCDTDLTGIRYKGKLAGETACGEPADDSGIIVLGKIILPDITTNYQFNVGLETSSGNLAFNELRTRDTLIVTMNKIIGAADNMNFRDSLEIILPEAMNINGTVTYTGTGSMSTLVESPAIQGSNIIASTARKIYLSFPIAAYNAAVNKGVGADVICKIPIEYTPNGPAIQLNPVQTVQATIVSNAQFGSCPEAPAAIGSASGEVALVSTNMNPYKAMLGQNENVTILSHGFQGSWYNDTIAGSVIVTNNPTYSFTPVDVDSLYYSVTSVFGGVDYGRVPVWIYVFPSLEFTVEDPVICLGDSVNLMSLISDYRDSVFFHIYRDAALTDTIPEDSLIVGPIVTTEYYVEAYNRGDFKSSPVKITLTVLPEVFIDEELTIISTGEKSITFNIAIVNGSDMPIGPPLHVTLYKETPGAANIISTAQLSSQLAARDTAYLTVSIPDITIFHPLHIILQINDDGNTFPYIAECNTSNNTLKILNPLLHLMMKKNASVDSEPHNGTYPNPVSILFTDTIYYEITAVNVNETNGDMIVRDTLPAYLRYVENSGSAGITHTPPSASLLCDILTWTFIGETSMTVKNLSYKATPEEGVCASQPLFANRAWISASDTLHIPTNATYHQGAGVSLVTFSSTSGGYIFSAEPQAVDYNSTPRRGIRIAPDEGFLFAGWSHEAYISLKGKPIPAQQGIMYYDTLTVYGNVELKAHFEAEIYPITYYLHESDDSGVNPITYTIESSVIQLTPPQKTGDTFIGWTGSNGDVPQLNVEIPAGSTGNRTYFANFLHSGRENREKIAYDNEDEEEEERIWASQGKLNVQTSHNKININIFTTNGTLLKQQIIPQKSLVKIPLERGIYVVSFNQKEGKKIIID